MFPFNREGNFETKKNVLDNMKQCLLQNHIFPTVSAILLKPFKKYSKTFKSKTQLPLFRLNLWIHIGHIVCEDLLRSVL